MFDTTMWVDYREATLTDGAALEKLQKDLQLTAVWCCRFFFEHLAKVGGVGGCGRPLPDIRLENNATALWMRRSSKALWNVLISSWPLRRLGLQAFDVSIWKSFFFLSRLRRLAFSWIFFVSSLKFWVFSLLKKVSIILPGRGAWLQWGGWTHLPHIQGPSGMHSVTCIGWQEEVGPPAPGWLLWCPGVVLWRISCNQDYDMKWFRVE